MLVGFVGCGLIGTSLIDLCTSKGVADRVIGVEPDPAYRAVLEARFPAHTFAPDLESVKACDVVFVCTPTASVADLVLALKDICADRTVIVDTASVKTPLVEAMQQRGGGFDRYVPGHPMAGGRMAGPDLAKGELLAGKPFLLTPYDATSADAVAKVSDLLNRLGFKLEITRCDYHDQMVALTSHLPHLFAYALVKRFTDLERAAPAKTPSEPVDAQSFAGRAFLNMAHFAGANPEMWSEIFGINQDAIDREVGAVGNIMGELLALGATGGPTPLTDVLKIIQSNQQNMEKSHEDKIQ